MENNVALILLAHGSKNICWKKPFVKIQDELQKENIFKKVKLAFFELDIPLLEDVVEEFENCGFKKIKIEPLLLANGYHIQKDLPKRIKALESRFNKIKFITEKALIDRSTICDAVTSSIIDNHLSKKISWFDNKGKAISCSEKIKVLNDGFDEILSDVRNFLDDAVLLGCSQNLTKLKILKNIKSLSSQYKELKLKK